MSDWSDWLFGNGDNYGSSGTGGGGGGGSSTLAWAQFIDAINQRGKKPNFTPVPMSPQTEALWKLYYQSLTNPAFANNAGIVQNYATEQLNSLHPTWDAPKTSTGETGYSGGSPQHGQIAPFDWNSYIAHNPFLGNGGGVPGAGGAGTPPPLTTNGSGPNGQAGDPFGHVTSIPGGVNDPFAGIPDQFRHEYGDSNILGIISTYGRPTLEGIMGAYAGNPLMIGKSIWDFAKAWHDSHQGKDQEELVGAQDTQNNPFMNIKDQPDHRTPVQNPSNTMFDPMGFGDQSRFNNNLANDPGQIGSVTQGGDKGFGWGMDYSDNPWTPLPGGPRAGRGGGGSGRGGLV